MPITKTPLPNPGGHEEEDSDVKFSMKEHSKHVLFCGTQVIQTRFYGNQKVKALVIRTGKILWSLHECTSTEKI